MTTHHVELRPSRRQPVTTTQWFALTLKPITEQDALALCTVIGPHWEARVVPVVIAKQTETDLWALFDEFPRWKKAEVNHHPSCGDQPVLRWSTTVAETLTGAQWLRYNRMEDVARSVRARAAGMGVMAAGYDEAATAYDRTVLVGTARDHVATCPACGAEAKAASVQISIVAGCRHMTREYAL